MPDLKANSEYLQEYITGRKRPGEKEDGFDGKVRNTLRSAENYGKVKWLDMFFEPRIRRCGDDSIE